MPRNKFYECIELGNRLRELRNKMGYSQEAFAELVNVHRTYLGGLERGERNPTLTVLNRLAKALKTPLSKLLDSVD